MAVRRSKRKGKFEFKDAEIEILTDWYREGYSLKQIAKKFGVGETALIGAIKRQHVELPTDEAMAARKKKLTSEQKATVLAELQKQTSLLKISEQTGVPYTSLRTICLEDSVLKHYVGQKPRDDFALTEEERKKVFEMAQHGVRAEKMWAILDRSKSWWYKRLESDDDLKDLIEQGRSSGENILSKQAYVMAKDGNLEAIKYFENTRLGITPRQKIEAEVKQESTETVSITNVHSFLNLSYEEQMELIQKVDKKQAPREIEGATTT